MLYGEVNKTSDGDRCCHNKGMCIIPATGFPPLQSLLPPQDKVCYSNSLSRRTNVVVNVIYLISMILSWTRVQNKSSVSSIPETRREKCNNLQPMVTSLTIDNDVTNESCHCSCYNSLFFYSRPNDKVVYIAGINSLNYS